MRLSLAWFSPLASSELLIVCLPSAGSLILYSYYKLFLLNLLYLLLALRWRCCLIWCWWSLSNYSDFKSASLVLPLPYFFETCSTTVLKWPWWRFLKRLVDGSIAVTAMVRPGAAYSTAYCWLAFKDGFLELIITRWLIPLVSEFCEGENFGVGVASWWVLCYLSVGLCYFSYYNRFDLDIRMTT